MVLENSYSQFNPTTSGNVGKKFLLITIAPSDYKYFTFDPNTSQFNLYNINHSLYTTVNVPIPFSMSTNNYGVCFVTKSLFDCDSSNLEYGIMNLGNGNPSYPTPYFAVYRENGTLFQKIDSCRFLNYGQGWVYGPYSNSNPIINTPNGAKLILGHVDGNVKIYGLCGTNPTSAKDIESNLDENSLPYPNPSSDKIILPYKIRDGKKGVIIIYNTQGQIIKEFEVDSNFNNIILEKNELSNGTYFYTLKTKYSETKAKKFILTD